MLEVGSVPLADLRAWFDSTPIVAQVWLRLERPEGSVDAWGQRLLAELAFSGVVALRDGRVHNP